VATADLHIHDWQIILLTLLDHMLELQVWAISYSNHPHSTIEFDG
jgi:hypothetical protein